MNAANKLPTNRAEYKKPVIEIIMVIKTAKFPLGVMSPYPTLVKVIIVKYKSLRCSVTGPVLSINEKGSVLDTSKIIV
ncbi:hypothetical protein JCM14036_35400 [Desulfotomaculum defluvii]